MSIRTPIRRLSQRMSTVDSPQARRPLPPLPPKSARRPSTFAYTGPILRPEHKVVESPTSRRLRLALPRLVTTGLPPSIATLQPPPPQKAVKRPTVVPKFVRLPVYEIESEYRPWLSPSFLRDILEDFSWGELGRVKHQDVKQLRGVLDQLVDEVRSTVA